MKRTVLIALCLPLSWLMTGPSQAFLLPDPNKVIGAGGNMCRLLAERNRILQEEITLLRFQGHELKPAEEQALSRAELRLRGHEVLIKLLKAFIRQIRQTADLKERQAMARLFAVEADTVRLKQLFVFLQLIELDEKLNRICLDRRRFSLPELRPRRGIEL